MKNPNPYEAPKDAIHGDNEAMAEKIRLGGKFVKYDYVISLIVVTLRYQKVVWIDPNGSRFSAGLPYSLMSFVLGWWGLPFGILFTIGAIGHNCAGGTDVTYAVAKEAGIKTIGRQARENYTKKLRENSATNNV